MQAIGSNGALRAAAFGSALALALAACGDPQTAEAPAASETPEAATAETAEAAPAPASADRPEFGAVDTERLLAADAEPDQWMSTGRTYSEQHFSPLDQIDTTNISDLGLAWYADLDTNQNQQSTPLFVDGVLYVSTAWSKVYAFDGATGEQLWYYDPMIDGARQQDICCGVVNRGVAAWNGKIYVGVLDGRLVALDAGTGQEVWSTQTFDPALRYAISGAPRVAEGKVLIGEGGAEFGVRGYLAAFDAETGEEEWRFYTVPTNPALGLNDTPALQMAAETWNWDEFEEVGSGAGGTVWDGILYDPETRLVYFGTGNGTPWTAGYRGGPVGEQLFIASIVAVDIDTGEYRWHYQATPAESWDFDTVAPLMTADLEIDGQMRHVLMQATKGGIFYVLDAESGQFLSATPFVPQNWSLGWDPETGAPNINPDVRYEGGDEAAWVTPGPAGAHSWHPMSFNPETGLVYFSTRYSGFAYLDREDFEESDVGGNLGIDMGAGGRFADTRPEDFNFEFSSSLIGWNPVTGEKAWEHGVERGGSGGTVATAGGLVFEGTGDTEFAAFDARNGAKLWNWDAQTGIVAAPISYEMNGEQYVAVVPGRASQYYYAPNNSRVLVFKLGGSEVLPEPVEYVPPPINPPAQFAEAEEIAHGEALYDQNCSICHGNDGNSRSTFPDLRRSARLQAQPAFDSVVLDGALARNGMASFAEELDEDDSRALRAYVVSLAEMALEENPALGPAPAADAPDEEPAEGDGIHDEVGAE